MEEVTEELVELSSFAPLIQIWAGICLLFFYEILLKNFPLEKTKNQTKNLFDEFTSHYQGYIEPEKMPQFDSFQGTKWETNFLPTIKNMAALSFFFSIFILACIGIEKTTLYKIRLSAIQIINLAVWGYMMMAILFSGLKIFHTYWTCIVYSLLLIVFYHLFPGVNGWMISKEWIIGESLSESKITVMTLFTCASPLPLILLHLFYDWLIFRKRKRKLKEINENFALMTQVMFNMAKPADFPKKLQKKILKKVKDIVLIKGEVMAKDFNYYLTEEIKDEFDAFTSSWMDRLWRKWQPSKRTLVRLRLTLTFLRKFFSCKTNSYT
jgi:hypothetical protein